MNSHERIEYADVETPETRNGTRPINAVTNAEINANPEPQKTNPFQRAQIPNIKISTWTHLNPNGESHRLLH